MFERGTGGSSSVAEIGVDFSRDGGGRSTPAVVFYSV
jgi:hypothetical protein